MRNSLLYIIASIFFLFPLSGHLAAEVIFVSSQQEFDAAHNNAMDNDSIVWKSGTYSDIFMDIDADNLTIMAEELGSVVFTGASRVDISQSGDYITMSGFQFVGGDIGTDNVINTRGSYNVFTQINIRAYTCYKYLRVREESQYCEITYCNFENRINLADQNILSILVSPNQPGYHKIQYCSFKNFDGGGNDDGIEPIRIGVSTQANFISRSLVEYCYFTQCNGDGEIISSKATQNVYRYNTFENNPKAELVLRHGSEAIVYGNFFLKGKGGVRVREGQDHYIYNNYFFDLDDRSIFLQNEDSDPLDNINIAFNTIVDCDEMILGGDGNDKPTNVTIANNIFSSPKDKLFDEPTGTENWIGNIAFGNLGITQPNSGLDIVNPQLLENNAGYFGLTENSPAIDAAQSGFAPLPNFEGIADIDVDVLFDLMVQDRPASITDRDLGCSEFPHEVMIQPIATEENTGPSYNSTTITSLNNQPWLVNDLITVYPNPVDRILHITISNSSNIEMSVDIYNSKGAKVDSMRPTNYPDGIVVSRNINDFPAGIYIVRALSRNPKTGVDKVQSLKFIKL